MHQLLENLKAIIIPAAREELLPHFSLAPASRKADGSVVTEVDLAMQRRLAQQLLSLRPEAAFLGEEMSADEQTAVLESGQALWCLDPLDGTGNFVNGIPYFAVSLALLEKGGVVLGMVYDPIRDECFMAARGQGASLNGEPLRLTTSGRTLKQTAAIVDFKRLSTPLAVRLVSESPFASQRNFGASALDWCWLAAGRGQLYLHGRQNIWDYAAGNLIFAEAGGRAVTLQGEPVFINRLVGRSVVAAVDETLFAEWTRWLAVPLANS